MLNQKNEYCTTIETLNSEIALLTRQQAIDAAATHDVGRDGNGSLFKEVKIKRYLLLLLVGGTIALTAALNYVVNPRVGQVSVQPQLHCPEVTACPVCDNLQNADFYKIQIPACEYAQSENFNKVDIFVSKNAQNADFNNVQSSLSKNADFNEVEIQKMC
jgi:hypothetical protein